MTVRKDPVSQLSQLRSPAAVQAAIDEFVQLGRTKFLARHGYGKSRDFLVRDPKTGTDCDSKAIAGVAFGKQFPEQGPLTADSFSGGEATVVPALTRLGFRIIRIGEDWSEEEVLATVEDYFDMLRAEAAGEPYNKSEHNQALRQLLNGRSKSSVELKHQNISAYSMPWACPISTATSHAATANCCCVNPYTPTFWNISRRSALLSMPWRR